jgi:alkylhydroperoxidase/carboxymuconolactone decarboxylase family protein YurZ
VAKGGILCAYRWDGESELDDDKFYSVRFGSTGGKRLLTYYKETKMADNELPPIVQRTAEQYPQVWDAYNNLGRAVGEAGPLDAKTERLVKLAIAVGANLEGAVRAHTRRGLAAELTKEEMQHVALLGITTVGWPSALAGFSWVVDELEKVE